MALDPSIALGIKPVQIESPINQMAKMYEMQNIVQANKLNQMKMDEYTRGVAKSERFNNALAQAKNEEDVKNAFISVGDIKGYQDYLKGTAEQAKLGAETTNLGYTGKKTLGEIAKQRQDYDNQAKRNLSFNSSNENVIAWGQDAVLSGVYTKEEVDRVTAQLLAMPLPERQAFLAGQGATAGDLSTAATAKAGQAVTMRGQDISAKTTREGQLMTDARERQRISEGNRRDVVASTLTDAAGNVTQYNKFGELIGTKRNAGKPSAAFEKTKAAKQQLGLDLDLAIKELTEATKEGGLIETATGSGAGALRDIGAGFFGQTTAGAEALGALQPIYDKVLKMVPRFEGPQSDKDTISYNKAAGDLGNPNAPTGKKLAAAKTILRLMKDRKAEFLTRDLAEGGAVPNAGGDVDASNPLLN
jgi:hypothetical protein